MKKFFTYLIIILLVLLTSIYLLRDTFIKIIIENLIPPITGTSVTVSDVKTSPFNGEAEVSNFIIKNPPDFTTPNLLQLEKITIKIDLTSLLKPNIVINQINVQNAKITFEINQMGNNISTVQKNINDYLNKSQNLSETKTAQLNSKGKSVIIQDLIITGTQIEISSHLTKNQKALTLPIPTLHLTDIGKDNQQTISEIIAQILSIFSKQAIQSLTENAPEILKQTIGSVKEQISGLKQNLDETQQQLQSHIKKTQKELKENLKNTFKNIFE